GMAEAEHAALAEENVVAQADDDDISRLRQDGHGKAAAEQQRGHAEYGGKRQPDDGQAPVGLFDIRPSQTHVIPSAFRAARSDGKSKSEPETDTAGSAPSARWSATAANIRRPAGSPSGRGPEVRWQARHRSPRRRSERCR